MKKLTTLGLAVALSMALASCAKSPESIAPVSMAGAYDNIACKKAGPMLEEERQTLAALETQQKAARTGDAIGVQRDSVVLDGCRLVPGRYCAEH